MRSKQKQTDEKITLITFATVKPAQGGASATAFSIAKQLYAEGKLGKIICVGYDAAACGIPKSYFVSPPFQLFHKLLWKWLSFLSRFVPLRERRIREELFDFLVSKNPALTEAKAILFAKPLFPRSAKIASKSGIQTFGLAVIFHPRFNYMQVKKEQKRYGLRDRTNYTDKKRVNNISCYFMTIDHVLTLSRSSGRTFVENGVSGEKIYNVFGTIGADCNRFQPKTEYGENNNFKVIHISHMNLIKGIGYLLEAWKNLHLRNAELILAGDMDPDSHHILKQVNPPQVTLKGYVSDISSYLKQADVYVHPSISDASPATVVEAMASGVPVIVSNTTGTSDIITHGMDGFVYRYNDVAELQDYILWCYRNRNRLEAMGIAARQKALKYQRRDFAAKLMEAIDHLI